MVGHCPRQQKIGGNTGVIGAIKVGGGGALNTGCGSAIGIVDQNVNLAQLRQHFSDKAGNCIGIALVKAQPEVTATGQRGGKFSGFLRFPARHHQCGPRFRQGATHGRSQPAGRAGQHGDFAL